MNGLKCGSSSASNQSPPPRGPASVRLSSVPRRHHSYSAGIPPLLAADFEKEARKGIGCVMASRRRRETNWGIFPTAAVRVRGSLSCAADVVPFCHSASVALRCTHGKLLTRASRPRSSQSQPRDGGAFCSGISDKKVTVGRAKIKVLLRRTFKSKRLLPK